MTLKGLLRFFPMQIGYFRVLILLRMKLRRINVEKSDSRGPLSLKASEVEGPKFKEIVQ